MILYFTQAQQNKSHMQKNDVGLIKPGRWKLKRGISRSRSRQLLRWSKHRVGFFFFFSIYCIKTKHFKRSAYNKAASRTEILSASAQITPAAIKTGQVVLFIPQLSPIEHEGMMKRAELKPDAGEIGWR